MSASSFLLSRRPQRAKWSGLSVGLEDGSILRLQEHERMTWELLGCDGGASSE
jgi:hypothetical protein